MIFDRLRVRASAALTPQQLAALFAGGSSSAAGVKVTADSAMRYAAVFSCVRVLAESVGQLPLNLLRRRDGAIEKATDLPLWAMLQMPNKWQTWQEFAETCVAHLALRGNFYATKTVVRGEVRELIPLHPDAVSPRQLMDSSVVYDVTYLDGRSETLQAWEVFHVKLFSLGNGVVGLSPISYMRESVGLGIATERHGAKLFANGARPGGILITSQKLGKEGRQRVRDSFAENYGGENIHKLAVIEGGDKYEQIGLSSEDAQFLETRKFQRSEIAGIFRVPPYKIGDLERATFSNVEHQGRDFRDATLLPYLRRIEGRINATVIQPKDRGTIFAEFDTDDLVAGDMKARGDYNAQAVLNGWKTRNEVRAEDGLKPLPGLNEPLRPANTLVGNEPASPPAGGGAP